MISSYGLKFIFIALLATVVLILLAAARDSRWAFWVAVVTGVLTLFLVFFYRNPQRLIPSGEDFVLSIADGRVISVEKIDDPYIGGPGTRVSIFMSVMDPHINRIPSAGKLEYVKYNPGKFELAFRDKASELNENAEVGMAFEGGRMIFKQIAGFLARRIVCELKPAQKVKAGEIFGLIHFGSRAEIYLPATVEVLVKDGDHVLAGQSVIGKIAPPRQN